MAGHSKWANIQHRKGRQDAKRSKLFSKLSKEITVAAKMGTPDPDMNPRLRLAINNAKAQSMPKDNIERAIKKAAAADGETYEEIRYEGRGPEGVGVIVEALTDNRNRTASEVRSTFTKFGGALGETGSVSFGFDRVGMVEYPTTIGDEDTVLEAAIECGGDDVVSSEDNHLVYCTLEDLNEVAEALEKRFGEPTTATLVWRPQMQVDVSDGKAETMMKLFDALDDLDDVQNVYSNFEISDAAMEKLAG